MTDTVVPAITDMKCGADCVTLSWKLNYEGEPVKYVIKWRKKKSDGEGHWNEIPDISEQTFVVQDLLPSTEYFLQVTAYTDSMRSPPSEEKECRTTRGEPVQLTDNVNSINFRITLLIFAVRMLNAIVCHR